MSQNESTTAIVPTSGNVFIAPVADVQSALIRFQMMKDFIDNGLRAGTDFGIIPGTNKPTLLKPGAEKLSNFFGLAPHFEIVEKELDWTGKEHDGESFFYFHYRCRLLKGDILAAEGEGSANSFEKKYRWRLSEVVCPDCGKSAIKRSKYPPRNQPNAQPGWYCYSKAGGCGAEFPFDDKRITEQSRGQVKNPDIADVVNTLQKMAQKRAYVAAVLLAVNGSEYFTQDVEDFVEGEYSPVTSPVEEGQQTGQGSSPTGKTGPLPAQPNQRPYSPKDLRTNFNKAVAVIEQKGLLLGPDDPAIVKSTLISLAGDDVDLEGYFTWISGIPTYEDMSEAQVIALLRLLKPNRTGDFWTPCAEAVTEAKAAVEAQKAEK